MSIYKDRTDFRAKYYVQLNNCGLDQNFTTEYTLIRPYGRSDYYILYVANGYLEITVDGNSRRAEKGQCVVYFPNEQQIIRYPADCKAYFAHFVGAAIDETMHKLSLERVSVCNIKDQTMFELYFRMMIEYAMPAFIAEGYGICEPKTNSLIFQLISMIDTEESDQKDDRILSQLLYINTHFKEDINIGALASKAYISPSRFAHMFTKRTGISPHKLITSLRIDEAKKLLVYSSMTINEICYEVGFSEPAYFSRTFKKITGCSPSEYRKQKKLHE